MKKSLITALIVLIIAVGAIYKVSSYGKPQSKASETAFTLLTGTGITLAMFLFSKPMSTKRKL